MNFWYWFLIFLSIILIPIIVVIVYLGWFYRPLLYTENTKEQRKIIKSFLRDKKE